MANTGIMLGEATARGVAVTELVPPSSLPGINPLLGTNPADTTKVVPTNTETAACELAWFQGGTLGAPTSFVAWKTQPRDPTKGFFGAYFPTFINSTVDNIMSIGYNPDLSNADVQVCLNFEEDYEVAPGVHIIECYVQFVGTDHVTEIRPWYFNVDKATNIGIMQIELIGPAKQGSLSVVSGDQLATYFMLDDTSVRWKNNYKNQVLDALGNPRDAFWIDNGAGGGTFVVGDKTNAQTWIYGGTSGIQLWSDGVFRVRTAAGAPYFEVDPATSGHVMIAPVPSAVPATVAGQWRFWVDAGSGQLKIVGPAGTVTLVANP